MSTRTEVLLWANRIVAKRGALPHQLLEISADGGIEAAQEAFHKLARIAHPDLHRTTLNPEELELVTTAYARVAGAYQEMRSQRMKTSRIPAIKADDLPMIPGRRPTKPVPVPAPEAAGVAVPAAPPPAAAGAAGAMNSKALLYYRKAELSLRRGDLKTALLQIKMAIAGDPQSTFLRTALTELEAELAQHG